MKGYSTTDWPNQPKHNVTPVKKIKLIKCDGLKIPERVFDVSKKGKAKKIKIAAIIARTPPNLSGIVRNIA